MIGMDDSERNYDIVQMIKKIALAIEKKEVFGEGCREDEHRIANAQRELHARMSESDRVQALKWISYYQALLQEDYDRT